MASFHLPEHDFPEPPRPTTPPVRRSFLLVLAALCLAAGLVYGIPYVARRAGHAWEAGRAQAATEALRDLDEAEIIPKASALFRLATAAVAPAVVNIQADKVTEGLLSGPLGPGLIPSGLGSGVVVDKDQGYIVTNYHVVRDARRINVRLGRGSPMRARLVGFDEQTDLAVLKVGGSLPVAARWGDSDQLDIGDWVLAIGSPFALDRTVTAGIISATRRNNLGIIGETGYEDFLQTDAAINPGNSGGPLVNLAGEVVGINTAIFSPPESGGNVGIGMAISSALARRVVEQLIATGQVVRGYIGVIIQDLNEGLAQQFHLPEPEGALILDVQPGSPAEQAGLQLGDVIVAVNGREIPDTGSLRNQIASLPVDSVATIDYYREGQRQSAEVTIAELPSGPQLAATRPDLHALGFSIRELPGPTAEEPSMLVIDQVVPNSPAARAGVVPGSRVIGVGRRPIATLEEFEQAIARRDLSRGLPLLLQRPDDGALTPVLIHPNLDADE